MAQCEHVFIANSKNGEVKCNKCGNFDDEMQLFNKGLEKEEEAQREKDAFESSQVTFE